MRRVFYSPGDEGGGSAAPASPVAAPVVAAPVASAVASGAAPKTEASKAPAAGAKAPAVGAVAKPKVSTPARPTGPVAKQEFDLSKWDGNVDTLPESSREYARLAADRATASLRAEIEAAKADGTGTASKLAELQKDLDIYKALAEGLGDPRVDTLTERLAKIEASEKTWKEKHKAVQAELAAHQKAEDDKWAADFKEKHADILGDKVKNAQFFELCDGGWEEEAAAQLVKGTPELLKEAESVVNTLRIGPDGHAFAVQHARMKLGLDIAPRTPRVAATITSGAQGGQKIGSRVSGGSVRDMPRDQARRESAKLALKLVSK